MSDDFDPLAPAFSEHERTTQPGFLIRRLHQIHLALFHEECTGFGINPVQYTILAFIAAQPGMDQSAMSAELGIDRPTLVNMVARLEEAGYLRRAVSRFDKRQKLITLSARGKALLADMQAPVSRAGARTFEALPAESRGLFLDMLRQMVAAGQASKKGK